MRQEVSVKKAIIIGQLIVNLPVILCLIGMPIFFFLLASKGFLSDLIALIIGVLIGITLAWLIWSILITKWRIWAFSNVKNVHQLRRQAIHKKLIWETGTTFERTEYRSKKDKLILEKLEKKFKIEDVFEEDFNLPQETKIYFSIGSALFVILFFIFGFIVSVYLIFENSLFMSCFGIFLTIFSIFMLKENFKNLINRQPQIVINTEGIKTKNTSLKSWSTISDEQVLTEGFGSSAMNYLLFCNDNCEYTKISIDNFAITASKLENILRTYRIRFNKNNKI